MTEREFEHRLTQELRTLLADEVKSVDTAIVIERVFRAEPSDRRPSSVVAVVGALGVSAVAVGLLILGMPRTVEGPGASLEASTAAVATGRDVEPTDPPKTPSGTSTPSQTERERSDAFWTAVSDFAPTSFRYKNLGEIVEDSHLVVVGRVIDMETGSVEPFDPSLGGVQRTTLFGVVEIDAVLKGTPATARPDRLLVARLAIVGAESDDLPSGQVILFLKNYAQLREDEGTPPSTDPSDAIHYVRANEYQCVLRVLDGEIEIVDGPRGWEEALGPFPSALDGEKAEDVIARIRNLVARQKPQ